MAAPNPEEREVIRSSDLPDFLMHCAGYDQADQRLVSVLTSAGHSVDYTSSGRSFTFTDEGIIVDEGESKIVATSKDITQLNALHDQHLQEIKKAKQTRLKQLDEECRLEIRRITEDFDERKKQQQEENETRLEQLRTRAARENAQEEARRKKEEATLRERHSQEVASYEQKRKQAVANAEAAKARTEAKYHQFTNEMKVSCDKEVAKLRARQTEASNSTSAAQNSYSDAVRTLRVQLEAARASLSNS